MKFSVFDQAPKGAAYYVSPYYTSGSDAVVTMAQAWEIAYNEVEEYKRNIRGVYGEAKKIEARNRKVDWLVFAVWRRKDLIYHLDLITGEIKFSRSGRRKDKKSLTN